MLVTIRVTNFEKKNFAGIYVLYLGAITVNLLAFQLYNGSKKIK